MSSLASGRSGRRSRRAGNLGAEAAVSMHSNARAWQPMWAALLLSPVFSPQRGYTLGGVLPVQDLFLPAKTGADWRFFRAGQPCGSRSILAMTGTSDHSSSALCSSTAAHVTLAGRIRHAGDRRQARALEVGLLVFHGDEGPQETPTSRISGPMIFTCVAASSSRWVSRRSSRVIPPVSTACDSLRLNCILSRARRS